LRKNNTPGSLIRQVQCHTTGLIMTYVIVAAADGVLTDGGMLVRDSMSRNVITTVPTASADAARGLLRQHRIRQLAVVQSGRLIGIVTDRDLRGAPQAATVDRVMTARPHVISPDASMDEAARFLRAHKIGALPVTKRSKLLGIVTVSDVLDAFVRLSGVGEPTYRLVVCVPNGLADAPQIRRLVHDCHGELKWLHVDGRRQPAQSHLRLKVREIDDLVTALEGAGFDVEAVVASPCGAE
jgi:acetoin utilization protein AcuB